jgi:cysteine synthase A
MLLEAPSPPAPSRPVALLARKPSELRVSRAYLEVDWLTDKSSVFLKVEGFSIAGSIKLRTAISIIEAAEADGRLRPGGVVVESSSGNLGLALAILCAERGYTFVCVGDPNMPRTTARLIGATGAELKVVTQKDAAGGYLGSRLDLVQHILNTVPNAFWPNQYANPANPLAHYLGAGRELVEDLEGLSDVFVGAGTTGTLSGVSRYIREMRPEVRIWAVDVVGSVTFGGPGRSRRYPGLGTSKAPPLSSTCEWDHLVYVSDASTEQMLGRMWRHGLMFGPSTGTVAAAIEQVARHRALGPCIAAIAPDMADRYTDWMVP